MVVTGGIAIAATLTTSLVLQKAIPKVWTVLSNLLLAIFIVLIVGNMPPNTQAFIETLCGIHHFMITKSSTHFKTLEADKTQPKSAAYENLGFESLNYFTNSETLLKSLIGLLIPLAMHKVVTYVCVKNYEKPLFLKVGSQLQHFVT